MGFSIGVDISRLARPFLRDEQGDSRGRATGCCKLDTTIQKFGVFCPVVCASTGQLDKSHFWNPFYRNRLVCEKDCNVLENSAIQVLGLLERAVRVADILPSNLQFPRNSLKEALLPLLIALGESQDEQHVVGGHGAALLFACAVQLVSVG